MRTALVLSILVALGQAQQTPPPKFTAQTELVTVPVVVTRSKQFVSGLSQSDFTVLEDGKPQPIAFFEEVTTRSITSPANAPGEFSNRLVRPTEHPPLTMIVLDRARTPLPEFNNAVNEIKTFVGRYLRPGTPTMLAEVDAEGLRVLQDFTTSPEFILDALNGTPRRLLFEPGRMEGTETHRGANNLSMNGNAATAGKPASAATQLPAMTSSSGDTIGDPIDATKSNLDPIAPAAKMDLLHEAIQRAQDDMTIATLQAMEQIARSVSGIPGRKTLIWTSPGYVCPMMGSMKDLRGRQVAIAERCETIWRLLNAANVSVYPIVPTQTENPTFSSGRCAGPCVTMQHQLTLLSYGEYTGGKVCTYRNDLDECYHRAAEDSLRYYELSYYAIPTDRPTWRKIEVKVNRPHTSVRARRWYMAGTEPDDRLPPEEVVQNIAAAVVSPIDYTAVPMVVRWTGAVDAEGKKRASFEVRISPETLSIDEKQNNRLRLDVVAIEMDGGGRVTNALQQSIDRQLSSSALADLKAAGLTYTNSIGISPSAVRVKFVVRDAANGRIGTVNARLPRSWFGEN